MPVTKDQAEQLAALACAARHVKAQRWETAGVVNAIGRVRHLALADVALAVFRAADDPAVNTPGVIANPRSACWHERATDRPEMWQPNTIPAHERCSTCSKRQPDCARVRFADDDHEFTPASLDQKRDGDVIAQIVQATKAELVTHPTTTPTTDPEGAQA